MHANADTINRFYSAFARIDPDAMSACYAESVQFDDEVFSLRSRVQTMAMWRMLCEVVQAKEREFWRLDFSQVQADADSGSAHWDANYRFSATGRLVQNRIDARFVFDADGLIARHHDRFDFWRWSRQAFGAPGLLLGWSPLLRTKVRQQANANLQRYLARNAGAPA